MKNQKYLPEHYKDLERYTILLEEALKSFKEFVEIVDTDEIIRFSTMEKHDNISADKIINQPFREIYETDGPTLRALSKRQPVYDAYCGYKFRNGKTFNNLYVRALPIWRNDQFLGVISVVRDHAQMEETISSAIHWQKTEDIYNFNQKHDSSVTFDKILGSSKKIKVAIDQGKKAVLSRSNVLLIGETGTGKDLFAQSIHNHNLDRKRPFVSINCAAIPGSLLESILFGTVKGAFTGATDKAGLFEEANNGTLFLDEINSIDVLLQAKLLRVLQNNTIRKVGASEEIKINTRIISAINTDPFTAIETGLLREDLYYRLASLVLEIPPLRDRGDDYILLARHFVNEFNERLNKRIRGFSPELKNIFVQYSWPGNVRELRHLIEHAMNICNYDDSILELQHINPYMLKNMQYKQKKITENNIEESTSNLPDYLKKMEKLEIIKALKSNYYNQTKAATSLGISKQSLHKRMKRLDITITSNREISTTIK